MTDVLMSFVQVIDDFVYKACPVIAAGVTVGIIFWAASSYGAFTIMQVCYSSVLVLFNLIFIYKLFIPKYW